MDPQIKKQRTLDAIKRIVVRESLKQPLIVIFEDLHWIDSQTQALLDLLAGTIAISRVLLLFNYRPEYRHEWTNKSYYSQLRLDPLGGADGAAMLAALLGESVELNPLKRLITARTGGNPFFIEEIVRSLFDDGTLTRNGSVKLTRALSQTRLPPTVQGILAARMDRLSAPQKELLQTLAVIGRKSPMGLLERVFPLPSSEVAPILAELQASEFIYEQPAANDVEYVFRHALTQEVAYNSLLVERRRGLHARAGEAIEEMYAERLDGHLVELAHHYSHSAITMKGVEYLYRVGEQTSARLPNQEAINYLIAALELLRSVPDCPERAQRELAIQLSLAGVWRSLNGWNAPEVESAYRRALVLTQDSEDPSAKAPAAIGLAFTYLTAGKERAAIELCTELAELASKTDDLGLLLRTLDCMGQAYWIMGDYLHGLGCMERLIALYRPGIRGWRPEYDYSAILAHRPQVLIESGFPARAVKSLREALAFVQTFDDKMAQIIAVEAAADVQFELRDTDGLFEYSSRLSALLEEVPNPLYIASCEALKGWALVRSGKFDEALKQVRRTHEIAGPVRSCFCLY
jgi:predicted ATPase